MIIHVILSLLLEELLTISFYRWSVDIGRIDIGRIVDTFCFQVVDIG
jgi:hypothetical protein